MKNTTEYILAGPFAQLLTMDNLALHGPLTDDQLSVIADAGIVYSGTKIIAVGSYEQLALQNPNCKLQTYATKGVCLPAFVDVHTHICWEGSRASDFAARIAGKSYQQIAAMGGGIWDTVQKTRMASLETLVANTVQHANALYEQGVHTIEVKSGYGLSVEHELKILAAIQLANKQCKAQLVSTCLAAHIVAKDFEGSESEYLDVILTELLPKVKARDLSRRVDICVEEGAFSTLAAEYYLSKAKSMGFDIVLHGDQFSCGAAALAAKLDALSIDHLEAANDAEIAILAQSNCIPVALPGASLGIGAALTPARKLLDAGCSLVIATDWNPGSAPMGNLIAQTSILACYEKLSTAECFAAITFRAAKALNMNDRGCLRKGMRPDFVVFDCKDYREILYQQGMLKTIKAEV